MLMYVYSLVFFNTNVFVQLFFEELCWVFINTNIYTCLFINSNMYVNIFKFFIIIKIINLYFINIIFICIYTFLL